MGPPFYRLLMDQGPLLKTEEARLYLLLSLGMGGQKVVNYTPVSPLRTSPVKKMTTHLIFFLEDGQHSENCQLR